MTNDSDSKPLTGEQVVVIISLAYNAVSNKHEDLQLNLSLKPDITS